jgi:hypothetical protein
VVTSWPSRALVGAAWEPVKWLADENFDNAIIRGLLRQIPTLDIICAQDVPEISGQDDRTLLRFATAEGRVVVTHDVSTMIPAMRVRIESQCAPIVLVLDSIVSSKTVLPQLWCRY